MSYLSFSKGENVKRLYLFLFSIALRTSSHSPLKVVADHYNPDAVRMDDMIISVIHVLIKTGMILATTVSTLQLEYCVQLHFVHTVGQLTSYTLYILWAN